jgi:hypothetical protein
VHDTEKFFPALEKYFLDHDPYAKLKRLEDVTDKYNAALAENFELSDILPNIANVRRHW